MSQRQRFDALKGRGAKKNGDSDVHEVAKNSYITRGTRLCDRDTGPVRQNQGKNVRENQDSLDAWTPGGGNLF